MEQPDAKQDRDVGAVPSFDWSLVQSKVDQKQAGYAEISARCMSMKLPRIVSVEQLAFP